MENKEHILDKLNREWTESLPEREAEYERNRENAYQKFQGRGKYSLVWQAFFETITNAYVLRVSMILIVLGAFYER